jgi:hypothetical protein
MGRDDSQLANFLSGYAWSNEPEGCQRGEETAFSQPLTCFVFLGSLSHKFEHALGATEAVWLDDHSARSRVALVCHGLDTRGHRSRRYGRRVIDRLLVQSAGKTLR